MTLQSKTARNPDFIEDTYAEMRARISDTFKTADPLALELTFNLIHTANITQHVLAELAQSSGLTFAGFNVLGLLSHRGNNGMPLNEIGRLLLVSRANVTGLIDSLERKGLVERVDHATDRRIYLARITKKGETLLQAHRPQHFKTVGEMADALSPQDKKKLIELLKKWRVSLSVPRQGK